MTIIDYLAVAIVMGLVLLAKRIRARATQVAHLRRIEGEAASRTVISRREVKVATRNVEVPPVLQSAWGHFQLDHPRHAIVFSSGGAALRLEGDVWDDALARDAEVARLAAEKLLRRTRREGSRLHALVA